MLHALSNESLLVMLASWFWPDAPAADPGALTLAIAVFAGVALLVQYVSIALAARGVRASSTAVRSAQTPAVSIIRPVCGLEPYSHETLGSTFNLDWPQYEIIFCAADANDPVLDVVRRLMAQHPHVAARIMTGREGQYANPKLANMALGWSVARHDVLVFTDSNVLVPRDYLHRMVEALKSDERIGMVSAPPAGFAPASPSAWIECAMLNEWQARVQYAVDAAGFGFAQGKNLMFRRRDLEKGGFESLASEPAEDAAATKLMRASGQRVKLASPPFPQMLGARSFAQVWSRHLRWARLRRATFPLLYAPEIFSGPFLPLIAVCVAALRLDASLMGAGAFYLAFWYAPELALGRIARWPQTFWHVLTLMARDLMLPAIYAASWFGRDIVWNGHVVASSGGPAINAEPAYGETAREGELIEARKA